MSAITEFLNAYAGKTTIADELTAATILKMQGAYNQTYAKIALAMTTGAKDPNFATFAKQTALLKQIAAELDNFNEAGGAILKGAMDKIAKYSTEVAIKDLSLISPELQKPEAWHREYNTKQVEAAFKDAYEHIAGQTDKMVTDAKELLRTQATQVFRKAAVEGTSRKQAQKELKAQLLEQDPSFKFTDKAGRSWDLDKYLEMLTRTVMHNTLHQAYLDTLTNEGHDLVKISIHGATDACSKWEGKVVSITGATPGYPTLESLRASGDIFHPRCRHRMLAYHPDIEDVFDAVKAGFSDEEILKAGKEQQAAKKQAEQDKEKHKEALYLADLQSFCNDPNLSATFDKGKSVNGVVLNGIEFENDVDYSIMTDDMRIALAKGASSLSTYQDQGPLKKIPGKHLSAGVIVKEPDGRIWIYEPKDHYGGYHHTFSKGTHEEGLTLQQTAIKEAMEELGLLVKITGHVGDYEKSTSVTRYYVAQRIGGNPSKTTWESETVRLVTADKAKDLLNTEIDKKILKDFLDLGKKAKAKTKKIELDLSFDLKHPGTDEDLYLNYDEDTGEKYWYNPANQKVYDLESIKALYPKSTVFKIIDPDDPTTQKAKTPKTQKPVTLEFDPDYDEQNWDRIGPQKGSNEGGLFQNRITGEKFYIKTPQSDLHAKNEAVAIALYKLAGIKGVPDVKLVKRGGRLSIASRWEENLGSVTGFQSKTHKLFHKGFAADAWLANWDVVGLSFDNVAVKNGKAFRIDVGGSLLFRAQGGPKGSAFGSQVSELSTLRDASKNSQTAKLFKSVSDKDIIAGIDKIAKIKRGDIEKICQEAGMDEATTKNLADTLLARQADLLAYKNKLDAQINANKATAPKDENDIYTDWTHAQYTDQDVSNFKSDPDYDHYLQRSATKRMIQLGLAEHEAAAVALYTNGSYAWLNRKLYNSPPDVASADARVASHARILNEAIKKLRKIDPKYFAKHDNKTVYRKCSIYGNTLEQFLNKWKPGNVDIERSFMSTAFTKNKFNGTTLCLVINMKSGGLTVEKSRADSYSVNAGENEVIIPSGLKFKSLDYQQDVKIGSRTYKHVVYLEQQI